MQPRIENSDKKLLIGKKITMSYARNKVAELWKEFLPQRGKIRNKLSNDFISMAVYKPGYFAHFNPAAEFEKWAAVEVSDFENVPKNMETFILPSGLYAVFEYKGLNTDNSIYQYIFGTWIPNSGYELDDRPHFEILGEKYKNNDPDSEEEIWIPIKNTIG